MNVSTPVWKGVRNGVLTALYIGFVVTLMQMTSRFSGPGIPYLTGFMVLTLFVVSALITGSLMLWVPARLMLEGRRREAGSMLLASGITLVIFLLIVAVIALIVK